MQRLDVVWFLLQHLTQNLHALLPLMHAHQQVGLLDQSGQEPGLLGNDCVDQLKCSCRGAEQLQALGFA